jgi:hypothetical protein
MGDASASCLYESSQKHLIVHDLKLLSRLNKAKSFRAISLVGIVSHFGKFSAFTISSLRYSDQNFLSIYLSHAAWGKFGRKGAPQQTQDLKEYRGTRMALLSNSCSAVTK